MKERQRSQIVSTFLTLLIVSIFVSASSSNLRALDDCESRILAVVRSPEIQAGDWHLDADEFEIQVIRSELSSPPETLLVYDATRLTQSDFQQSKTLLDRLQKPADDDRQIAWVETQGWKWLSPSSLPSQLPTYAEKPEDGFEAALFLDWLREIIRAKSKGSPLQIVLLTRDFPVPGFEQVSAQPSERAPSLPLQCWHSSLAVLTNYLVRLQIINFSSKSGYLTRLADLTAGFVTDGSSGELVLSTGQTESFHILYLSTSFQDLKRELPRIPAQPVSIRLRSKKTEWEVNAPQVFWPLPGGLATPTLPELLEAQQLRPRVEALEDPIQALVLSRRVVSLSPFDLSDRLRVIRNLRSIGNPDPVELERSVDESILLFPDSAELQYQKGLLAEEGGRMAEAIEWYDTALESDPDNLDLKIQLARLCMNAGQWQQSIEHFLALLETEMDSESLRIDLANTLRASGETDKAMEQLELVRHRNPGFPRIAELEMRLALDLKEYEQALEQALKVLTSQPKQPTANFAAGVALTQLRRFDEAMIYLEIARSTHLRDEFDLQFNIHLCRMAQSRLDEAADHLEAAAELRPEEPGIWMKLALLHERRGDQKSAGAALERGAQINNDDASFQLSLASWQERHGEVRKALITLEDALPGTSGQQRLEIVQRYVLLTLQESGTTSALESITSRLDPQLDAKLLKKIRTEKESPKAMNSQQDNGQNIILPGGSEPLFNYAPFLKGRTHNGDLLDLLFGYLLETEPLEFANQNVVQSNPRREEAITFFQEFLRFKQWLYRETGSNLLNQVITTKESDLEAANQILDYFGVKVREFKFSRPTYTPDPDSVPKLEIIVEPRYEKRRVVLKWFGISTNLIGEGSVLEFELRNSNLPVSMGMSYWNRNFLRAESEDQLLLEWLKKPQAMKLYRALLKLPFPARQRLTKTLTAEQLLEEVTPGLLSMGDLLHFNDEGRIVLPGGESASHLWERLLQVPAEDENSFLRKLFTQDDGKALYFLVSLSNQRCEILSILTSEFSVFKSFYEMLSPPPPGNFLAGRPTRNFHDMADLLAMLETDGRNVFFPTAWQEPSSPREPENLSFRADDRLVRSLFETEESGVIPQAARKYAMLQALNHRQTPLVLGTPKRLLDLGAFYWLVTELGLESDQIVSMLRQIDSIEANVSEKDRRSVLALFQAPLVILRILSDNKVLTNEDLTQLTSQLLSQNPSRLGDMALQVTSVIMAVVRGLEGRYNSNSPLELLLQAFAEQHEPVSYIQKGKTRSLDLAKRNIEQMRSTLEEHYVAPLDSILKALSHLRDTSGDPEAVIQNLSPSVEALIELEIPLEYLSDRYREAIEHTSAEDLKASLGKFRKEFPGANANRRQEISNELARQLAHYLVDALISLVYVRYVRTDDMVVQTDEHFFRKHEFEERSFTLGSHGPQAMGGSWGQPILVKDRLLGSRIVGSLAGIVRPLARLKAEQLPARSSTRFADSTYPVTQKLAVELVDALGLTNEALICVGRTLDVARKLLAASLLDQKLRTFVFDQLSWLCGARRSWEARQSIQNGDFQAALDLILPSELFQLGRRYWLNQSEDQSSDGPVEFDLPWFFENSTEFVCSTKSLVDELGFPTTTFFGVDLLLVDHLSSIEAATTFNSPHRAAERSCELKFYMADLFWRMGLPSTLFKPVCDKILDRILPKVGQVDREDWRAVTQQLQTVTEDDVVEVISELFEE